MEPKDPDNSEEGFGNTTIIFSLKDGIPRIFPQHMQIYRKELPLISNADEEFPLTRLSSSKRGELMQCSTTFLLIEQITNSSLIPTILEIEDQDKNGR